MRQNTYETTQTEVFFHHEHTLQHYIGRLMFMHYSCSNRRLWKLNYVVFCFVFASVLACQYFETKAILISGVKASFDWSVLLCKYSWVAQCLNSMVFLVWWQTSGNLYRYFKLANERQTGELMRAGERSFRIAVWAFRTICVLVPFLILLDTFGPMRGQFIKYNKVISRWAGIVFVPISIYAFICWTLSIFMYNILIQGAYLEVKHFNKRILHLNGDVEIQLTELIWEHSRISRLVAALDEMFKVFSFVMISIIVPSILLTLMFLSSLTTNFKVIMVYGFPTMTITFYGFLGITLAPARLYEEILRSKSCLCQNINIWRPYNKEVYQQATVLSSHLEQPTMGMTIWGFAMLSKPLILATFSVMLMVMSLVLDVVPTLDQKLYSHQNVTI